MLLESEKNCVAVSDLLISDYSKIVGQLAGVTDIIHLKGTKDYWCRDYMPLQRESNTFIEFSYNPDYLLHKGLERYITDGAEVLMNINGKATSIKTSLKIDGGNVVIAVNKNGKRMAIMTEKVFYENDSEKRKETEQELKSLFGIDCELLFLPWDIYDVCGHTDGIVHPISKGQLLVNLRLYEQYIANEMRRRLSEHFNLIELPLSDYHELSWTYINMVRTRDFIAIPSVRKPITDREAFNFVKSLYPQYGDRIIQIDTRHISEKYGGSLNCMAWTFKDNGI